MNKNVIALLSLPVLLIVFMTAVLLVDGAYDAAAMLLATTCPWLALFIGYALYKGRHKSKDN